MRTINQCLNPQLSKLCEQSLLLEELSCKLSSFLPEGLATHCQVGSFNKGCLILTTNDPVWASQLRYAIPELRDKLRKEAGLYQLTTIKIALSEPPPLTPPTTKKKQTIALSEKTKALIISESQQYTYQPLQQAILQLAKD
jgi:hypothetical protein